MQQPIFRDVLWSVIDLTDRGVDVLEATAFEQVVAGHPDLTRDRFDEIVDMLVSSGHLRRWSPPLPKNDRSEILIPTAKARLQLAAAEG